jgi:hypothetical protein
MSLRTDTYPTTPPAAVAPVSHRQWKTPLIALLVVTLLAIGAVVAVAQLANDGSGSVAHPRAAAAPATIQANACGPEMTHLLATIEALPPTVVTSLSPDLAAVAGILVANNHSLNTPAATPETIGRVLAQVKRADRNAIMAALPVDQEPAVAAAEAQTADAFWASGGIPACFS